MTTSTTLSTSPTGSNIRVVPRWPGWPPRFLPVADFFGRCTFGPSDDGGADEFVELRRNIRSMSSRRPLSSLFSALS